MTYEHRQFSPWPLAIILFAAFAYRGATCSKHKRPITSIGQLLFLLQFCVLTTRVDEDGVSWGFGFGFPSGAIPFRDIAKVELIRTKWWEGAGLHWSPRNGWLWNANGLDAVRIRKRRGGIVTLGSDDARTLCEAIRSHIE